MDQNALTVTALTKYIRYKFDHDDHLKDLLVEGEISNFKHNVRGHFYFTLKDDHASISAVMFRSDAMKVQFKPQEGMKVILRGYISVFEQAGSYQIYVKNMNEVGLGNLYQAYLQLKEKLEKQGWFDEKHKQPLPLYPKQIAILTSATGAAVRDIIHIINRRYPLVKLLIYPTTVQGDNAKHEIVENIHKAHQNPNNDLIILGRGGGSIEDLWAFNEAIVAEAIFTSTIPIISAVGHETDFTIADFVADKRAPTPSGAAEIAVPDQRILHRDIQRMKQRLEDTLVGSIKDKNYQLTQVLDRYIMKEPNRLLMAYSQRFEHLNESLRLVHPHRQLKNSADKLTELRVQLSRNFHHLLNKKQDRFNTVLVNLDYVNPLSLMKKGYTLTRKNDVIVKSVKQISVNDTLETAFHDGVIEVTVNKVNKTE